MPASIYADREAMDATTPHGRAMLQMAAVFAELERAMIRERVNAGLARAKAAGKTLGRPGEGIIVEGSGCADPARGRHGHPEDRARAEDRRLDGAANSS